MNVDFDVINVNIGFKSWVIPVSFIHLAKQLSDKKAAAKVIRGAYSSNTRHDYGRVRRLHPEGARRCRATPQDRARRACMFDIRRRRGVEDHGDGYDRVGN